MSCKRELGTGFGCLAATTVRQRLSPEGARPGSDHTVRARSIIDTPNILVHARKVAREPLHITPTHSPWPKQCVRPVLPRYIISAHSFQGSKALHPPPRPLAERRPPPKHPFHPHNRSPRPALWCGTAFARHLRFIFQTYRTIPLHLSINTTAERTTRAGPDQCPVLSARKSL